MFCAETELASQVKMLYQALLAILTLAFEDFNMFNWMCFSIIIFLAFRIADKATSSLLIWNGLFNFETIKSNKILTDDELTMTDHVYTFINRMITTPIYIYHSSQYYKHYASVDFDCALMNLMNPLNLFAMFFMFIGMFCAYDFIYYIFHRIIHIPKIYPYIHKHHHRQVSPFRGTYDGMFQLFYFFLQSCKLCTTKV